MSRRLVKDHEASHRQRWTHDDSKELSSEVLSAGDMAAASLPAVFTRDPTDPIMARLRTTPCTSDLSGAPCACEGVKTVPTTLFHDVPTRAYALAELAHVSRDEEIQNQARPLITFPTWRKVAAMARYMQGLEVSVRRSVFAAMRGPSGTPKSRMNHDTFLPRIGMTAGEFSIVYTLADKNKRAPTKAAALSPAPKALERARAELHGARTVPPLVTAAGRFHVRGRAKRLPMRPTDGGRKASFKTPVFGKRCETRRRRKPRMDAHAVPMDVFLELEEQGVLDATTCTVGSTVSNDYMPDSDLDVTESTTDIDE